MGDQREERAKGRWSEIKRWEGRVEGRGGRNEGWEEVVRYEGNLEKNC